MQEPVKDLPRLLQARRSKGVDCKMAVKTARKSVRGKRRERKNIERGQAHIRSSFNNTIVTITDTAGTWTSQC